MRGRGSAVTSPLPSGSSFVREASTANAGSHGNVGEKFSQPVSGKRRLVILRLEISAAVSVPPLNSPKASRPAVRRKPGRRSISSAVAAQAQRRRNKERKLWLRCRRRLVCRAGGHRVIVIGLRCRCH